ncbi:F-box domain-containing protein [Fusarium keratoplasticum]|uniref:F-box domain-containing protein n=1 Tax=Fusarium keratoplasticum TaxID=1328300 RepID=A0ACC0QF40_9HYPO|nr:F-box domain-containing protein [Fusarium keratoplasticum]KAI8652416.1 F-box domain-containing protein [Fusarium keratoplasticum]
MSGLEASLSGESPADEDDYEQRHILAHLLKQKFKFPKWGPEQSGIDTLDLFIVCRNTFDAFDRLYSPVNQAADFVWQTRRYSSARQSPLEKLPSEILRDIVSALEITDQIAAALCSQYLGSTPFGSSASISV